MNKELEYYERILSDFESDFDKNNYSYRDDEFMKLAIQVFCIETLKEIPEESRKSIQQKAALSVIQRLMAIPELKKEWLVTFPYPWMDKEKSLSEKEIKRRKIGFRVWKLIEDGAKVTHAIAKVAADIGVSAQKVAKDYYDHKLHHEKQKKLQNLLNLRHQK